MVIPELQLLYLHPTKTAGMAVENAFFRRFLGADIYCGELHDDMDRFYPPRPESQHYTYAELLALLPFVAAWRKCVTVRHPYDRALSEFKFQRRDGLAKHAEINAAIRDGSLWANAWPYHDRPQADYLAPGVIVLRHETLDADWARLAQVLDADLPPLKKVNVSHGGCGLTDESQAIIYRRFKVDFDALGYTP